MNMHFTQTMTRATRLTRAGIPGEATRIIQEALSGRYETGSRDVPASVQISLPRPMIELSPKSARPDSVSRPRMPLGDVLKTLRQGKAALNFHALHGRTQNPEDFATGTNMNALAEAHGLAVIWPEQTRAHNASACWNWFRPGDQRRDAGEPAILAGITRPTAAEFNVPDNRIFAAGLSSGGAMAAILGETWPDLFSAIGVHSGLPPGCAGDVVSAFSAMCGDARPAPRCPRAADASRLIVFHGSADRTVHPSNGERLFEAASGPRNPQDHRAAAPGGRVYTRSRITASDGSIQAEYCLIEGAGHAWSGGHAGGSYTDPAGPDASMEMLRFFLNTPK
jgi:poly(hydroxyalkanoate) depolymerase family esterase